MGGGGPAKAAEPKVTPFVEPAAPQNPIPNWFANRTATNSGFEPDFGQSQQSFGQQPMQGNTGIVPPVMQQPVQQDFSGYPRGDGGRDMPFQTGPSGMQEMQQHRMHFGIPTRGMDRRAWFRERYNRNNYTNYTDTDPMQSTGPDGASLFNPGRR